MHRKTGDVSGVKNFIYPTAAFRRISEIDVLIRNVGVKA